MITQNASISAHADLPSAELDPADRRRSPRLPVKVLVEYEDERDFVTDYTSNVNLGGMFIRTQTPLALGTRFRLRFQVQGRDKPIDTTAVVRWTQPAAEAGPLYAGMGIQFDALSPADVDAVNAMLESFDDWG